MNTETLIQFFTAKLEKIPDLRKLNNSNDPIFTTWWNTVTSTCERMGESYKKRANKVHYYPGVITWDGDNSAAYARSFQSGLDDAEAFIKAIIEELETWGYGEGQPQNSGAAKQSMQEGKVVLNLTISQQQAQQIKQTIDISQYDPEVQEKVRELLDELKKESKDKPKIISAVKWLADKGVDALIAILLAAAHLT